MVKGVSEWQVRKCSQEVGREWLAFWLKSEITNWVMKLMGILEALGHWGVTTLHLWSDLGWGLGWVSPPIEWDLQEESGICGVSDVCRRPNQSFKTQDKPFKCFLLNEPLCHRSKKGSITTLSPPMALRMKKTRYREGQKQELDQLCPTPWETGFKLPRIERSRSCHPAPSWRKSPDQAPGGTWLCGLSISTLLWLSRSPLSCFSSKSVDWTKDDQNSLLLPVFFPLGAFSLHLSFFSFLFCKIEAASFRKSRTLQRGPLGRKWWVDMDYTTKSTLTRTGELCDKCSSKGLISSQ